jgi:hypothetical protein
MPYTKLDELMLVDFSTPQLLNLKPFFFKPIYFQYNFQFYLSRIPFQDKTVYARHFCPSCHQKRVVEFGEWLCEEVLKAVPHRHFIFSIPKILRTYFLYDRRLLSDLSRCSWDSLKMFFQILVPEEDAVPGAVIAIQTFGDFLGFNPHCHVLCTDGGFYGKGMFRVSPCFIPKDLEKVFRYKVFEMLLSRKKITEDLIEMMMGWRHSGFNVYCEPRIQPGEEEAMENLARYIIRASFS